MENIIISKKDMRDIRGGVRIAVSALMDGYDSNSCVSVDRELYHEYIEKHKSEIMQFLPVSYICIKEKHHDVYVHYSSEERIAQILKDGYLSIEHANEDCSVGEAIYTYPLESGMFFCGSRESGHYLIFETDEEHHHIVQTDDTPYAVGEANFFCDKLYFKNAYVVRSYEEMEQLCKEKFDWSYAKKAYYGLTVEDEADHETFLDVVEKYHNN